MANGKRLIDANDLWHKTFICEEPGDFRKAIENAPTVDAVEVVRCKDCKHREESRWFDGYRCGNPDEGMASGVALRDNDFCSYGERRDNERKAD